MRTMTKRVICAVLCVSCLISRSQAGDSPKKDGDASVPKAKQEQRAPGPYGFILAQANEDFSKCEPGKGTVLQAAVEYVLYVPRDIQGPDRSKVVRKSPLILHLHGSAPSDFSGEKHKGATLINYAEGTASRNEPFPFFIVAPVMPGGHGNWLEHEKEIFDIVDAVAAHYPIDTNRVYLTGFSMGGIGTWSLAIQNPGKFAAIAPICGWGMPAEAWAICHLPIWVFHGARDAAVPLAKSQEMVDALRLCGNEVKFTVYPEAGHDSWTATYNNPGLYEWFLKHERVKERQENKGARIACSLYKGAVIEPGVLFIEKAATAANVSLRMKNPSLADGKLSLSFAPNDAVAVNTGTIRLALSASSEKIIDLQLRMKSNPDASKIPPLRLVWSMAYTHADIPETRREGSNTLSFASYLDCPGASKQFTIDGNLDEWRSLPFKIDKPARILQDPETDRGPDDCRCEFGLAYDEQCLYVAVKVTDDTLTLDPRKAPWEQDGVEIRIDARDEKERSTVLEYREFQNILLVALSPARSDKDPMVCYNRERMPEGTRTACVRTRTGFNAEIAVSKSYLDEMQGKDWESFRFNMAVDDYDPGDKVAQFWWQPDWRGEETLCGTGTFKRK